MNGVPTFSLVSAISEVFVTIAVLYSIISNVRGKPLPWKLLGGVLAFELMVNIVYMAGMAAKADKSTELSTGMKLFFAGHGILSLFMFLGLAVLFMLAVIDIKNERKTWFERHKGMSWVFVGLWMISVGTGEAIFLMRYGPALSGETPAETPAAAATDEAPVEEAPAAKTEPG